MGLLIAASKFDSSKNVDFLTYAGHYIRCYIQRFVFEQKNIHIPIHILEDYFFSPDKLESEQKEYIDNLMTMGSLNKHVLDNDESEILDLIPDEDQAKQLLISEDNIIRKRFNDIIKNVLSDTEYDIVCKYFGINHAPMIYEDIANEYNISITRVRKIVGDSIKKLRHRNPFMSELKSLKEWANIGSDKDNLSFYLKDWEFQNTYGTKNTAKA